MQAQPMDDSLPRQDHIDQPHYFVETILRFLFSEDASGPIVVHVFLAAGSVLLFSLAGRLEGGAFIASNAFLADTAKGLGTKPFATVDSEAVVFVASVLLLEDLDAGGAGAGTGAGNVVIGANPPT